MGSNHRLHISVGRYVRRQIKPFCPSDFGADATNLRSFFADFWHKLSNNFFLFCSIMNYIYKNQLFKRYQGDNFRYFKTLSLPVRHRLLRHNRISEPLINFVQIFTTQNVIFCRIFANFDNLTSKEKFCRNINVGILNFICNINILFICDMSINKRLVLVLFIFYYFNSYFGCVCGI